MEIWSLRVRVITVDDTTLYNLIATLGVFFHRPNLKTFFFLFSLGDFVFLSIDACAAETNSLLVGNTPPLAPSSRGCLRLRPRLRGLLSFEIP